MAAYQRRNHDPVRDGRPLSGHRRAGAPGLKTRARTAEDRHDARDPVQCLSLAEQFLERRFTASIGSNDMTQLALG